MFLKAPRLKASVLAIDDDGSFLAALRRSLEANFERVDCATSLEEAWKFLEAADYDLIMLDVMLDSEPSGLAMCRRLKADPRRRGTPVLIVSIADLMYGMSLKGYLGDDGAVPADGFIDKLAGAEEIVKRARSIIEKPVPDEA